MFGKTIIGIAQNLTHRFNLAGGGNYNSSNRLNTARFALLLVHTLLLPTLLPAQTQQMRVVIGHNRLAILNAVGFSYGHFSPPSSTEETTVRIHFDTLDCEPNRDSESFCDFTIPAFPHHGIIMWINHDSGWQPSSWFWQQLRINGQETVRFRAPGDTEERDYRIYLLPYHPDTWQQLSCFDGWQSFLCFVFEPYGVSVWEQRAAEERKLIIYVDEYGYYWQLCRHNLPPTESPPRCSTCCEISGCWVQRDNWDGTPDFAGRFGSPALCGWFHFFFYLPYGGWRHCWRWICEEGRPRAARLLFKGKVTSLPIISDIRQSADAAVDNRPVCPAPNEPPTFAKFGTYTHLGGLFVGQVPWNYVQRSQTAPDLSGTGRTLLKFYNPTGFPNRVDAACLSLVYTATPYGVATSGPIPKPIGVVAVPRSDWDENSVSWAFLQEVGLGCPFSEQPPDQPRECRDRPPVNWIGSTQWLHELVRPPDAEDALDNNGNLKIRPERGNPDEDWERNWRQIKRVVIPLSQWTAQGNYLSLLLALHPEQPFSHDLRPYVWYYFLGKEHELTDGRTCPRLWYVVKEQP